MTPIPPPLPTEDSLLHPIEAAIELPRAELPPVCIEEEEEEPFSGTLPIVERPGHSIRRIFLGIALAASLLGGVGVDFVGRKSLEDTQDDMHAAQQISLLYTAAKQAGKKFLFGAYSTRKEKLDTIVETLQQGFPSTDGSAALFKLPRNENHNLNYARRFLAIDDKGDLHYLGRASD